MANKKKRQQQQSQPNGNQQQRPNQPPKGQQTSGQQPERKKETPEEYRARQDRLKEEDINRIKQGGYVTIQQKTIETADTKNFINILDKLMLQARMTAGTKGAKHTGADLDEKFIPRINKAKNELNLLAAELCQLMGKHYRPPRGYINPLKDKRQQNKGKVAAQQAAPKKEKQPMATKPAPVNPVAEAQVMPPIAESAAPVLSPATAPAV